MIAISKLHAMLKHDKYYRKKKTAWKGRLGGQRAGSGSIRDEMYAVLSKKAS